MHHPACSCAGSAGVGFGLTEDTGVHSCRPKPGPILSVVHTDGNELQLYFFCCLTVKVARRSQPNHRGFVGFVVNVSVPSEDAADVFV